MTRQRGQEGGARIVMASYLIMLAKTTSLLILGYTETADQFELEFVLLA